MLTDIFAHRYSDVELWPAFGEPQRRLLVQSWRILSEQICPYRVDNKETERGKAFWTDLHSRIAMELGLKSLSPLAYAYQTMWNGKAHTVSGVYSIFAICENWMLAQFDGAIPADRFIKERLSLVEIGFRKRGDEIAAANADLPAAMERALKQGPNYGIRVPGDPARGLEARNARMNVQLQEAVVELNTRFRQAGCDLNYHNGFIQRGTDALVMQEVEMPFWSLVSDAKWANVDTDMKEALDRRDNGARDPAFYAARALESTIKIVAEEKRCTDGKERGAGNFIDKLASKRTAFLAEWEGKELKSFFVEIRNPMGHGPGSDAMPSLSSQQTDWAIEACMVWIKSIIRRL